MFFICFLDSFWTNPQCRFKICGGYSEKDGDKNIMVSLMQKPEKRNRHLAQNLHIGFFIFEVNITLCCLIWKCHDTFMF